MVVIHDEKDEADEEYPAEHCRRYRPLVYWNTEDPEDRVADRRISQDEQQFHDDLASGVFLPRDLIFTPGRRRLLVIVAREGCDNLRSHGGLRLRLKPRLDLLLFERTDSLFKTVE